MPLGLLNKSDIPNPNVFSRNVLYLVSMPETQLVPIPRATTFNSQPPHYYHQAPQTVSTPPPQIRKTLKPLSSPTACFCCLACDHLVKDCRDPVCCQSYCHSSNHSNTCKMPFSRVLAMPRWQPSIPVSACNHTVHTVPFGHLKNPPRSNPPSPPRTLPEHRHHTSTAYDPINMIPSSGKVGPTFEVLSVTSLTPVVTAPSSPS